MGGTFTLDASGEVFWNSPEGHSLEWSDLSPFVQGYIEAALRSQVRVDHTGQEQPFFLAIRSPGITRWRRVGFRHLAPDTLAAILKVCERATTNDPPRWQVPADSPKMAEHGRYFWQDRQMGRHSDFPPLTLSLSGDGKVRMEARS